MANAGKNVATRKGGGAVAKWEDRLSKYAEKASSTEKVPTGSFISVRGGILNVGGQPVKENKLRVIILGSAFENDYFVGKFDPDNPQSPVCYAIAVEDADLKPHEESAEPQSEACINCPMNEWGSAEQGRGKACQNRRRLALLSADDLTVDGATDGEAMFMKVPVTSTKGWAHYVKALANNFKRPPFAVVTEISAVPDQKSQFKVTFTFVELVEDEALLEALEKRYESMQQDILFGYPKTEAPAKPPRGGRSQAPGRAAAPAKKASKAPGKKPQARLPAPAARGGFVGQTVGGKQGARASKF